MRNSRQVELAPTLDPAAVRELWKQEGREEGRKEGKGKEGGRRRREDGRKEEKEK